MHSIAPSNALEMIQAWGCFCKHIISFCSPTSFAARGRTRHFPHLLWKPGMLLRTSLVHKSTIIPSPSAFKSVLSTSESLAVSSIS